MKRFIPRVVKNILKRGRDCLNWDPWGTRFWSQEGEDIILQRIFESKKNGFYVDVGAHHPKRFSSTYLFYRKGWQGINIDAMPGCMQLFDKWRPRDINLQLGVAQQRGEMDYYVFNEPALNGFSLALSTKRNETISYHINKVIKVDVMPLSEILDCNMGENKIDFLSVDVEGLDLDVLKSNDWKRFRPKLVLVEILDCSLHNIEQNPITQFMKNHKYVVYAKTLNTVFFRDEQLDYLVG
jgi:FkbM family methyltransferase